jgi:transcriptional regulator with XRE-family HTH domain
MTQQQLAQAVGMPQPSIARIERGTVLPRTTSLVALLEATGHRLAVEPIDTSPVDREAIKRRLAMPVSQRTRQATGRARTHILRPLRRCGVPFVLIGELAEVVHGSPAKVGRVVEICHATADVAQERLALALESEHRDAEELRLHTRTDAGDDYDVLVRNAANMTIDAGLQVRVAALDDLIRIRRARHTPQDQEAAAVLRAIADG